MNYKIIDPAVQTASGALAGFIASQIVSPEWNMIFGMMAGGAGGMAQTVLIAIPLMAVLGSFEVMIPMMLVNMTAGMIAGMAVAMTAPPAGCLTLTGAATGLIIYGLIWNSNRKLTKGLKTNF